MSVVLAVNGIHNIIIVRLLESNKIHTFVVYFVKRLAQSGDLTRTIYIYTADNTTGKQAVLLVYSRGQ